MPTEKKPFSGCSTSCNTIVIAGDVRVRMGQNFPYPGIGTFVNMLPMFMKLCVDAGRKKNYIMVQSTKFIQT